MTLKKGSVLLVTIWSPWRNDFSRRWLQTRLTPAWKIAKDDKTHSATNSSLALLLMTTYSAMNSAATTTALNTRTAVNRPVETHHLVAGNETPKKKTAAMRSLPAPM